MRKAISWILLPLRLYGDVTNIIALWNAKDWVLTVGVSLLSSGGGTIAALAQQYPLPVVLIVAVGMLLVGLWTIMVIIGAVRVRQAKTRSQAASLERSPEHTGPSIDARDKSQFEDEGSTWYGRSRPDIRLGDDARASTKGSEFGKLQEGEIDPEQKPDEEVN